MTYEFDKFIDRAGTNSLKWQVKKDELPMWVADMDFACAPEILAALKNRVDQAIFGYCTTPPAWRSSICSWWDRRYGVKFEEEWVLFCNGVIPAIASMIRKFSSPADKILVQSPVYHVFFNIIENNGRQILQNELIYDKNGYEIDFIDLENKLKDPLTTMMILCNPHNPIGKIWSEDELIKIAKLCYENNVLLVSDEIHCDLTDPGRKYNPISKLDEIYVQNTITCVSPSKSFNLAGIQGAAVVAPNANLRDKLKRAFNNDEICEANAFATIAMMTAYNECEAWLDELREYIYANKEFTKEFLRREIPSVKLISSDATYLLWLDCSQICSNSTKLQKFLRRECGLWLSEGEVFRGGGDKFLRINIACPKERLKDGLNRLKNGVNSYLQA